jgi:hypothetical protein
MEKEMIEIVNISGSVDKVEVVTYLVTEDGQSKYLVYTKGETQGAEGDQVIYISKIISEDDTLKLDEIQNDEEWSTVQQLLKKIANSNEGE